MEEAKAAAYYDELTRKGEGAARFKQGLGFSSDAASVPARLSSSSSLLSSFVRSSGSDEASGNIEKNAQLASIQNKLRNRKPPPRSRSREGASPAIRSRSRSPSSGGKRKRSRSPSRRAPSGDRTRSQSRSPARHHSRRDRQRSGSPYRDSSRRHLRRSRSRSPSRSVSRGHRHGMRSRSPSRRPPGDREGSNKGKSGKKDYSQLIKGYDSMKPADRVKAKMRLQISEVVAKDTNKELAVGSSGHYLDVYMDHPIDNEIGGDDASPPINTERSFNFSKLEIKRKADLATAHDEAIFGVPSFELGKEESTSDEEDNNQDIVNLGTDEKDKSAPSLLNDKVLSIQPGSWRDRARKSLP